MPYRCIKDLSIVINLLFIGPDICGPGTKKVHVIFNYKDKNLLIKRDITCKVSVIHCGIVQQLLIYAVPRMMNLLTCTH